MPMVFLLGDLSSDGRFLGASLVIWTFPMTTMGLIMLPKMVAVHFPPNGSPRGKRGSSSGVRVSGLPSSEQSMVSRNSHVTAQSSAPQLTPSQVDALSQANPRLAIVTQF